MKLKSKYLSMILTLTSFLLFSALASNTQAAQSTQQAPAKVMNKLTPVYGGTLRIAEQYDGTSIGYPPKLLRVNSSRQAAPAIETLFRIDDMGNTVPWLAESYKNDVKGKGIIIKLRKGVKFHDGTDFNAEAAKWNLDQAILARTQGTEMFRSIDVVDNFTIRINLTEWNITIITNLSQMVGMMISPTAFKKNGEDWCMKNPVGTGPFRFVSWEKDVRTVYRKFDGYWQKGKPYLDEINYIVMADQLTQTMSLKKGEVDLALWISAKDIPELEKDGFVINYLRSVSGSMGLLPDSANPKSPFADVRVRRAAKHAIDSDAIVKTLYFGLGESANQYAVKRHWGYNPAVVGYPYDPAKARKLLTEAGHPNGFKTKLGYRTNPVDDQIFAAIQSYLKAVGIDAELEPMTTGRYDQIAMAPGGKWEGLIINALSPNPDIAGGLAARYSGGGIYFNSMLIPEDYARAIKNAITAPDFKTEKKWLYEAQKLMIDKYALQIPIAARYAFVAGKPIVHNHGILANLGTGLWTPEETWLEKQ
jgi:peptide/nickel transport system substrate-binding protein